MKHFMLMRPFPHWFQYLPASTAQQRRELWKPSVTQ